MNKFKLLITSLILTTLISVNIHMPADAASSTVPQKKPANTIVKSNYVETNPVDVVAHPEKYLNKNLLFNTMFVAFTSIGLDYEPINRASSKYIGVMIYNNEPNDIILPLSEMKLFLKREDAEKHIDLESGDKIKVYGTVFSTAMGDPWVDIKEIEVISQKNKPQEKK